MWKYPTGAWIVGGSALRSWAAFLPAGQTYYGRARQRQITNDRKQDGHDTCSAKTNLVQHDELKNYSEVLRSLIRTRRTLCFASAAANSEHVKNRPLLLLVYRLLNALGFAVASWLFFKARATSISRSICGARKAGKQPTGHGPEGCVENGPAAHFEGNETQGI